MKTKEVAAGLPKELVVRIASVLDEISCEENCDKADFVEALMLVAADNIGTFFAIKGEGFDTPQRVSGVVELFSDLLVEAIEIQKKIVAIAGIDSSPCDCCCENETHPVQ